jgi:hypothetical protein
MGFGVSGISMALATLAVSLACLYFYLYAMTSKLARRLVNRSGTLPALLKTRQGPLLLALGCETLICVAIWFIEKRISM